MSFDRSAVIAGLVCFAGLFCICGQSCSPSPANLPPEADDQSVSVAFNTPTEITLTASDLDGGPEELTFWITSMPQHGELTSSALGVLYTPDSDYSGPDSFTFLVNDGAEDSNTATVSITVLPPGGGAASSRFQTYVGTFEVTWQRQDSIATQSSEASGTVEFGNARDINQLTSEYGPGTVFSAIRANSPALVSNWRSVYTNGAIFTQVGGGTGDVSYGNLYILDSGQVAIELNVNGTLTETDCPAGGPCFTRDSGSAVAFFSLGGCPLVFVAAGPDLGRLEGTASETCTQTVPGLGGVSTQIATLTWSLTGVE